MMNHGDMQKLAQMVADELKASALFNKWLTFEEGQQYAKVSPNTLRKWINKGYIYASKTTGAWRIDRESIDDFFNSERF